MDPVILALDRWLPRLALWWVHITPGEQRATFALVVLCLSFALLAWRDWFMKKALLWAVEKKIDAEVGPMLTAITTNARAEAEAQRDRLLAIERSMQTGLREMEQQLIDHRVPLHLLVNTSDQVQTLRSYLDSRPETSVSRAQDVATRYIPPLTRQPTAYAHLLGTEEK